MNNFVYITNYALVAQYADRVDVSRDETLEQLASPQFGAIAPLCVDAVQATRKLVEADILEECRLDTYAIGSEYTKWKHQDDGSHRCTLSYYALGNSELLAMVVIRAVRMA